MVAGLPSVDGCDYDDDNDDDEGWLSGGSRNHDDEEYYNVDVEKDNGGNDKNYCIDSDQ